MRAEELFSFFQRPLSLAGTELRLLPSTFFGVQGLLRAAPRLPFGSYRLRPLQSLAMRNLCRPQSAKTVRYWSMQALCVRTEWMDASERQMRKGAREK